MNNPKPRALQHTWVPCAGKSAGMKKCPKCNLIRHNYERGKSAYYKEGTRYEKAPGCVDNSQFFISDTTENHF